jgi:hypothetical protein
MAKGTEISGFSYSDKSKSHFLRIIAETAPSSWLTQYSAFKSYLQAVMVYCLAGLRALSTGPRYHANILSSSLPQGIKLQGKVWKN